jgi:hypothetical protein
MPIKKFYAQSFFYQLFMAAWMCEAFQPPASPPRAFDVLATISMENMKRLRIQQGVCLYIYKQKE